MKRSIPYSTQKEQQQKVFHIPLFHSKDELTDRYIDILVGVHHCSLKKKRYHDTQIYPRRLQGRLSIIINLSLVDHSECGRAEDSLELIKAINSSSVRYFFPFSCFTQYYR